MSTLQERYEAVHSAILDGPNAELQKWIDSGTVWQLEGSVGRLAMDALRAGAVVLPPERQRDYWGNTVPSYLDILDAQDSPGSVANAEVYDPDPED